MKGITLEIEFGNISNEAREKILEDIGKDLMRAYENHKIYHSYDRIKEEEHIKYEIDFQKN